jgi:hypothetical protein
MNSNRVRSKFHFMTKTSMSKDAWEQENQMTFRFLFIRVCEASDLIRVQFKVFFESRSRAEGDADERG